MHINIKKKYYFISKFDANNIAKQDSKTVLIYRNYQNKNIDETLILKIRKYCKNKRIKFYLSNDIKLAIRLDLDGVYLPSFNKNMRHLNYSYKEKFEIIGSAQS